MGRPNRILRSDEWSEVRRLLEECLDRPPAERAAYLEAAAGDDAALREEVRSMLKQYREDDELLEPAPRPVEAAPASEGTPQILGKYLVVHKLGQGGMAEVFLAVTRGAGTFEKLVALKRVHPQFSRNLEFRSLFEYEARLGGRLNHANIVQVYDFAAIAGTYLLAMEYVDGLDLANLIAKLGEKSLRLPPECALYIAVEICRGLQYAHTRKDPVAGTPLEIVHRDVTPRNVIVSFEGEVKIVDFGIAKGTDRVSQTMTGALRGTLQYLAPEVAAGASAGRSSDLFGAAVVLYELLAQERLFEVEALAGLIQQIKDCAAPAEKIPRLAVTERLKGTLAKALSPRPADRFAGAKELIAALEECLVDYGTPEDARKKIEALLKANFSEEIARRARKLQAAREFEWRDGVPFTRRAKSPRRIAAAWLVAVVLAVGLAFPWRRPVVARAPESVAPSSASSSETNCMTQIRSEPPGASLSLNGIYVGKTPAKVALACGVKIEMTLEHPDYGIIRKQIRVTSKEAELDLELSAFARKAR